MWNLKALQDWINKNLDLNDDGMVDAQDAMLAIDAAEKIYEIAKKESKRYSPQFRAAVGLGTLLYARSFPYTIMFVRAFQVTGAPLVKEAMKKLSAQYVQARQEFMAQRPPMDRAQAIVAEYPTKMKQLKKVHAAALDIDDPREIDKAQLQIDQCHAQYRSAIATVSSLQAVLQTVDPYKISEIFGGVWVGISGCIAAAVAPSTQVLNFGMHLGEKLASVTNASLANLLQRSGTPAVSEDVTRWQTFTVDFACYVASVTGTFYWQRVANAFQGCLIGASLVVEGARVHLATQGQEIPDHLQSTLQLVVGCLGFAWQYKSSDSGQVPGLVKIIIFPLCYLESMLHFCAYRPL